MANRFPLIVDSSSLTIKELVADDNLDLANSGIVNVTSIGATNINVTGVVTATSFVGALTGTATGLTGTPNIDVGITTASQLGINTTTIPTKLYVSGNAASNIVALGNKTENTTLDFSTGNNFSLTLGASITLENPTGVTTGQSGMILILQDGTGSRTLAFGSSWDFPSATAPTVTATADALSSLVYFARSTTSIVTNSILGIGTL
jgi:hypothetical protein